jgi:hypothetical protein
LIFIAITVATLLMMPLLPIIDYITPLRRHWHYW